MNKKWKLISYVLAGALFLGVSGTTLTGCKDYDDDIDSLNARVDEVAKSASEALDSKVKALEAQITTLTNAKDQLAKDLDAAKADADKKVAEAKQAAQGAQGTADKALKDAQDALARVATLESQIKLVNETLTSLQGQIDGVKEQNEDLKGEIDGLKGQYEGLKSEVAGVKELVENNAANANAEFVKVNAKIDAVKTDLLAALNTLETSLSSTIEGIKGSIGEINGSIDGINGSIGEINSTIEGLNSTIKAIKGDAAKLRQEFDAANIAIGKNTEAIKKNADAIQTLQEQYLTLQKGLETQQDALDAYKQEVTEQLGDKVDQSAFETKINEVTSSISTLKGEVDGLAAKWQADIAAKIDEHVTSKNFATSSDLTSAISTLSSEITETLSGYVTTQKLETYLGKEGTITKDITSINSNLATLSSLFSKRLTAMIFAPTTYVDGIEVIQFSTLKYTNWVDLKGDRADGKLNVTINNGATKAEYYVSPSNVIKANVKNLEILLHSATNTKAALPLEVSNYEIKDGKMVVSLKKTTTEPFAGKGNEFEVMALQATVEPTAEEAKAGVAPVVTSDWARIYETSVVPYIHNTDAKKCDVDDADGSTGKASQFYSYKAIHSKGGSVVADKGICDTEGKYIVRRLVYDAAEPFDLNTLVTVCDKNGNFYTAADYGLKFKFELVKDYWLKDNHEVETNQQNFAKISEDGKITSQANDGTPKNADAIGREPMIQVTLVDADHNNNVVDVRYFKIKWIAEPKTQKLGELVNFVNDFVCGQTTYTNTVKTEDMNNKVYTKVNIGKEMFHTLYKLDQNVYADEAKAIAGTPVAAVGNLEDIEATGSTVTHNIKWTYLIGKITDAEYDAGKAVRTVYGRYTHKGNDADIIVFSLTLTVNIDKMVVKGYNEPQWNVKPVTTDANKVYTVNPALTSDAIYGSDNFKDCQIITSLLNGYLNGTPANVLAVVDHATSADFMFDKDRLTATLGAGWSVSLDGKTLLYRGLSAATINGGVIRLEESPVPTKTEHGVPTTAAQELLGKNVPVKLVAKNCANITKTVDQFLVYFMDPLKMTVNQKETTLLDMITGGSKISIENAVTLQEAFGLKRPIMYIENDKLVTNKELMEWYDVQGVTWDLEHAKTNLKVDKGSIVITDKCDNNWSDLPANSYNLYLSNDKKDLIFENKSNSALGQPIQVEIPVLLKTKWRPNLTDSNQETVTVTINPNIN